MEDFPLPKKRHEKWLETLYIPMMLSKTSQTLLQGLCPLFMNVFKGGYAVFLSLCLSLSGFSLQWTWAREMSFLVNAVSCFRKWSRVHPIKLFLSFYFQWLCFWKGYTFCQPCNKKNQSVLNRNQVLVMGKYHNNKKASLEMKFGWKSWFWYTKYILSHFKPERNLLCKFSALANSVWCHILLVTWLDNVKYTRNRQHNRSRKLSSFSCILTV